MFNPRFLFSTAPGLESILAFKDDPENADADADADADESDQNSDADADATGDNAQGEQEDTGAEASTPRSSATNDAKLKALERKLEKERKAREKLEAEKKAADDAKKSDLEKAQDAAKTAQEKQVAAERRVEELRIENEIRTKVVAAGIRGERIEATLRLIDRSAIEIEDGEIDGVDDAVEAVKKDFPEFFGSKATSSPTTGGGKGSDRDGDDDNGPQSDYEVGQALAKQRDEHKSRL